MGELASVGAARNAPCLACWGGAVGHNGSGNGDSVSADFNGDGSGDLALGGGEGVDGMAGAGAVNVIYGSPRGLSADGDQFWHEMLWQGTG